MVFICYILIFHKDVMKECKTRYKVQKGKHVLHRHIYALLLVNCWKISSTKTSHISQTHTTNSQLYTIRVIIYVKLKKKDIQRT